MGLPVEVNNLMLGSLGGYTVGRSLRFRSSATAYLTRTPSTTSDRRIWTASIWTKIGTLGVTRNLLSAIGVSRVTYIYMGSGNQIGVYSATSAGGGDGGEYLSTQVFRDPSAWYHIVVAYDSTQATSTNRIKVYINGVQITAWSLSTAPTLNHDTQFNWTSAPMQLAAYNTSQFFDGYLAEVNFIDGQALTPSSFGAYDTNGVWQPKKYSGTYGTNGFYLPFSNTTSTTTLVQDSSGNGNNWTPNNISLTAGTTYDSMIDSPTNSASSSNYAVLNPLRTPASTTISNGNLSMSDSTNNHNYLSTIGMTSGKWYFEFVASASGFSAAHAGIAISTISPDTYIGSDTNGYAYHATTGQVLYNNSALGTYSTWTSGDVIGVAYDADGGKLYVAKNNTWQNSGNPAAGTGAVATGIASNTWFFGIGGNPSALLNANFGQQPFTYTPPTGFKALNTYNLPAPSIANGAQYMAATTYTGNGTAGRVITVPNINEVGFAWVKSRSGIDDHRLANIVTGGNKHLKSNTTDAESTGTNIIQAFSSNTFTVGNDTSVNANGSTYVGWTWAANGTGVSNNSGTITSTVSANTTAGFSVVTYTGNSLTNQTVGHGLGVAPSMIIIKNRDSAYDWIVGHTSTSFNGYLYLNSTGAYVSSSNPFNNTAPTSTVFTIAGNAANPNVNLSTTKYVAYCFAAVRGYSAFGSYTGNGSTDGPFVYTGFRPRWVMIKRTDSTQNWPIIDTSRDTYNVANKRLFANLSDAEDTGIPNFVDVLSNGFKCRDSNISYNASGGTYIYAAFAENPFSIARAR